MTKFSLSHLAVLIRRIEDIRRIYSGGEAEVCLEAGQMTGLKSVAESRGDDASRYWMSTELIFATYRYMLEESWPEVFGLERKKSARTRMSSQSGSVQKLRF